MFDFGLPAFFDVLAEPQRSELQKLARPKTYRDGEILHQPSDVADSMGWIESGALLFGKYLQEEGFHTLARLGPGHHFGEFSAFSSPLGETPLRRLAAVAEGRTVVNEIAAEDLRGLFTSDPEYLRAFHFVTTARLALLLELYDDARRLPARQRIINFLSLVERLMKDERLVTCTQADVSKMLGLSKVTVNQTLRALTERGVISVGYGTIKFEDAARLHAMTDRV
ncbi:Crp/Fnr family transcriptional regulator [Henriciella algicola]|uniref:Crp/Fnr family transcriptional regulator n=1 Tax=Henriciella algicola TaxID=1608422 RepID=A0A399RCI1_9PROT|nr:Crp/Fnr family transcriptional regulator [Henriciella algicola]RIJ27645.1 Crp/Fnr family transcriptional regulator [Henriciella algicola]